MLIRVAPEPSELARPFWEGCNHGELRIQRCLVCGRFIHHPEPECPECDSVNYSFDPVSGDGTVETFTVVHRSFVTAYREDVPYTVGWIALPEQRGLRVFGVIDVDGAPSAVSIDAPVHVHFRDVDGFGAVPVFRLQ